MAAKVLHMAFAFVVLGAALPAAAHHSYADYDQDERYQFRGIITSIHWGNPHILFTLHGDDEDMRIEWVTVSGADKTEVSKEQFAVGEELIVIGSRNRNTDTHIMTLVKELQQPARQWRWISPSVTRAASKNSPRP